MYSLIDIDHEENKEAKEVNKNFVKNIKHKECIDVLFNKKVTIDKLKRTRSKLHKIGTYEVCKIYLSCFDDKGYMLDDGINSLAYFHKEILRR